MRILNRFTGKVIYENKDINCIIDLVEEAVKLDIILEDSTLEDVYFVRSNLIEANLESAILITGEAK